MLVRGILGTFTIGTTSGRLNILKEHSSIMFNEVLDKVVHRTRIALCVMYQKLSNGSSLEVHVIDRMAWTQHSFL